jgi:hypothetical protein
MKRIATTSVTLSREAILSAKDPFGAVADAEDSVRADLEKDVIGPRGGRWRPHGVTVVSHLQTWDAYIVRGSRPIRYVRP